MIKLFAGSSEFITFIYSLISHIKHRQTVQRFLQTGIQYRLRPADCFSLHANNILLQGVQAITLATSCSCTVAETNNILNQRHHFLNGVSLQ